MKRNSKTEPTALPWEADGLAVVGPSPEQEICVCTADDAVPQEEARANAELIAKAVNHHDEMLEALTESTRLLRLLVGHVSFLEKQAFTKYDGFILEAQELVKKVKGE